MKCVECPACKPIGRDRDELNCILDVPEEDYCVFVDGRIGCNKRAGTIIKELKKHGIRVNWKVVLK